MTTDITTPVEESAVLLAFKDRVREQAKLLCTVDGYCGEAIAIAYSVLGLGDVPRMREYTGVAHITGRYQVNVAAFDQKSADQAVTAGLARSLAVKNKLSLINLFGAAIAEPTVAEPETVAEQLPDDDQVTALKAKILELAKKHVASNHISRQKVNVRLAALGIEQIPGPKNWTFRASFPGYPGASAEYVVYGVIDQADAEAERDRLMQVDRNRGYVDPGRLRLPVPPASATVLTGTQDA
jgi:hypothetical protein